MAYLTATDLAVAIPAPFLNDACDDDRDGLADPGLLDQILEQASLAVDAYLGSLYAVPITPAPPSVKEAALVFACELVYARRLAPDDKSPWTERAKTWRQRLEKIGNKELPLDAATLRAFTPGAIIGEPLVVDASLR